MLKLYFMIVLQLSHSHHGHLLCQRNGKIELYTVIRQHADAMHHNRRIDYLLYIWRQTERKCSSSWKKSKTKKYTLNIFLLAIIFLTMKMPPSVCTNIQVKTMCCYRLCCFPCKSASSVVVVRSTPHQNEPKKS